MDASEIVSMLKNLVDNHRDLESVANSVSEPLAESYCAECGAAQSNSLESLWIDRYSEILGCESRPAAVACAIESLIGQLERCRKSIGRHRASAFRNGVKCSTTP